MTSVENSNHETSVMGRTESAAVAESTPIVLKVWQKVRIRFRKEGPLRFVSHHDLMRCWDRLLRRAELSVRVSEGFHPKPRISSPLSLALGIVGDDELIEIELPDALPLEEIERRLATQRLQGLTIVKVERLSPRERSEVVAVAYACPLPDGVDTDALRRRAEDLLRSDSCVVLRIHPEKPARPIDLKPFLDSIEIHTNTLRMTLRVSASGAARPEEVLEALGLSRAQSVGLALRRTRVWLRSEISAGQGVLNTQLESNRNDQGNANQRPPTGGDTDCDT